MPTQIDRMHVHSLRSSKAYFTDEKVSHGKMVTQKMVDMLPSSTMPRPILRSFGAERNVTDQAGSSNALSCITRATHHIPGIIKRTCSPNSVFFKRESYPHRVLHAGGEQINKQTACHSDTNGLLASNSSSQENTPPFKRLAVRIEPVNPVVIPSMATNERRSLRPRLTLPSSWNHRTSTPKLSSSLKHKKSVKRSSRYLLASSVTSNFSHIQSDLHLTVSTGSRAQSQIEVPSWRVDDIIAEQYGEELDSRRILRARNSQNIRRPPQSTSEDFEDTSDEAYIQRHARLETEEIKRERLSYKRIAEEEFRLKIEQREQESWRKRRTTRVDNFANIDPERYMPKSLYDSFDKVKYVHVREDIPLVAFGVKVPKPNFGPFSLPK